MKTPTSSIALKYQQTADTAKRNLFSLLKEKGLSNDDLVHVRDLMDRISKASKKEGMVEAAARVCSLVSFETSGDSQVE